MREPTKKKMIKSIMNNEAQSEVVQKDEMLRVVIFESQQEKEVVSKEKIENATQQSL